MFGRAESVMGHLRSVFADYYERYIHALGSPEKDWHFTAILKGIEIDSGIQLRSMLEVVGLFNGHQPHEEVQRNFYALGMAGKFADDKVDLVRDISKNRPNLLYALISQNEAKLSALETAIEGKKRLDVDWWNKHCPDTYVEYFEYIEHYYNQISSPKLRLACDLMMLAVVIGYDYDPDR
jgi:hypothetical protein